MSKSLCCESVLMRGDGVQKAREPCASVLLPLARSAALEKKTTHAARPVTISHIGWLVLLHTAAAPTRAAACTPQH